MAGLTINSDLIREEILDGAVGIRLGDRVQTIVGELTDEQIDQALDEVLSDDTHPIYLALEGLVHSVSETLCTAHHTEPSTPE